MKLNTCPVLAKVFQNSSLFLGIRLHSRQLDISTKYQISTDIKWLAASALFDCNL